MSVAPLELVQFSSEASAAPEARTARLNAVVAITVAIRHLHGRMQGQG
ncbi:MAG TPA: hypothetical protein VLC92_04245 [Rhodocyclaceae bacterium]|nr:hypothetical protein [Rhodocyclaceae bacterium]